MSIKKRKTGKDILGGADSSAKLGYGIELRVARIRAGLSQIELGAKLHCSGPTISAWENETTSPRIDDLAKAARILGVDLVDLMPSRSREVG